MEMAREYTFISLDLLRGDNEKIFSVLGEECRENLKDKNELEDDS